jgi:hypothetical protein
MSQLKSLYMNRYLYIYDKYVVLSRNGMVGWRPKGGRISLGKGGLVGGCWGQGPLKTDIAGGYIGIVGEPTYPNPRLF